MSEAVLNEEVRLEPALKPQLESDAGAPRTRSPHQRRADDQDGADGQDQTGQDEVGQDQTGQDETGQDQTGQDETGQASAVDARLPAIEPPATELPATELPATEPPVSPPGSAQPAAASPAASQPEDVGENYWPMFWSSLQAALLTVVAQFVFTIYIALQRGIGVELRLWNNVLPFMAMQTQRPVFESITRWASIATAITLAVFAIAAFVTRRRLQVQAGRSFAWLDIALIGGLGLSRAWWFDAAQQPARWMYAMVLIGLVGLAVSLTLVAIDYHDREDEREREREHEPELERDRDEREPERKQDPELELATSP